MQETGAVSAARGTASGLRDQRNKRGRPKNPQPMAEVFCEHEKDGDAVADAPPEPHARGLGEVLGRDGNLANAKTGKTHLNDNLGIEDKLVRIQLECKAFERQTRVGAESRMIFAQAQ